jgi:hypothetical protein
MNLSGDKSYTTSVDFIESYNFVVHTFLFEIIYMLKQSTLN